MREADEPTAPTPPLRSTCCSPTPPAARCAGSCPACPGSGSRPAWPATPAASHGRGAGLAAELARIGVGRSELGAAREGPPVRRGGLDRATRCSGAPCRPTWPPARRRAGWSTTPTSAGATASGWASSSTTWSRRRPPATTRSSTRRCSSGSIDTGGGNLVEGGRRFVRDFATAAAGAVDGRARRVRGRRRHRGDAGRGGAAHRHVRADPVHPADHQGPLDTAADRAADDQQVLRDRPRRGAQPGRAPGRERPAGLLHLLAQPRRPARRLGRRQPTARRSSRRWTPRRRSRGSDQVALLGICSGGMLARWCSPTSPRPATSTGSRRSASR